ncbi:MAG: preprotein translocase subunit SecG [Rhodothermales bacterium]
MYIFLIIVITLIALMMAVVVLLQSGKGGGLAGIASGGQTTQILGARQAPDFLEKATWTLGTAFIVLCILANFFTDPTEAQRSIIQDSGADAPIENPLPPGPGTINEGPATPAPATPAPAPPIEQE